MAYEMVMPYHLHMPSYFLETFTEYPFLMKKYAYFCYAPKTKIRRKVLIYRGFSLFCNSFQRRGRVLNLFSLFPYISAY